MAKYEAQVEVVVRLDYTIVLQVEARSVEEAGEKLHWEALGLKRQELDRLTDAHPGNSYDGQQTLVPRIGQIEEVPDGDA
jgi:hypothetical protein